MSRLGPATDAERAANQADSPLAGVYDEVQDRESAHERLQARAASAMAEKAEAAAREPEPPRREPARRDSAPRGRQSLAEAATTTLARTVASTIGRELVRGLMGGLRRRR
jgi:hypothetical protein